MIHRIHLNIGSNQGNRRDIIARAIALIAHKVPCRRIDISDYVESPPWGYESPHPFLNRGLLLTTEADITPLGLLATLKEIEQTLGRATPHRNADGTYRDRLIDIDIIDFDNIVSDDQALTLPHPRARQRDFVLRPLAQLDPNHPLLSNL